MLLFMFWWSVEDLAFPKMGQNLFSFNEMENSESGRYDLAILDLKFQRNFFVNIDRRNRLI